MCVAVTEWVACIGRGGVIMYLVLMELIVHVCSCDGVGCLYWERGCNNVFDYSSDGAVVFLERR